MFYFSIQNLYHKKLAAVNLFIYCGIYCLTLGKTLKNKQKKTKKTTKQAMIQILHSLELYAY